MKKIWGIWNSVGFIKSKKTPWRIYLRVFQAMKIEIFLKKRMTKKSFKNID